MKTDKEIEQAAKRYVEERKKCGLESDITLDEIDAAFIAGAEWAQQNKMHWMMLHITCG